MSVLAAINYVKKVGNGYIWIRDNGSQCHTELDSLHFSLCFTYRNEERSQSSGTQTRGEKTQAASSHCSGSNSFQHLICRESKGRWKHNYKTLHSLRRSLMSVRSVWTLPRFTKRASPHSIPFLYLNLPSRIYHPCVSLKVVCRTTTLRCLRRIGLRN